VAKKSIACIYDFFSTLRMEYTFKPKNSDNRVNSFTTSKIKRNDPCPCGSGQKYKKCCMDITFH